MQKSINPESLANPVGPYSECVLVDAGRLLFISGCVGRDASGSIPDNIHDQMDQAMRNMGECLKAAGATFGNVVKINSYTTDFSEYNEIAPIRQRYLSAPYPASTMVEVKSLIDPRLFIEIEAIAVLPQGL